MTNSPRYRSSSRVGTLTRKSSCSAYDVYLTFKLSSRDLVQMMAERGISLTHTTILRWMQRYVPEFEKRWNRYARQVGDSWRVDTYLKIKGQWVYLYRAVDKAGRTVDFLLSRRRDLATAARFFFRATKQHGAPRVITLDGYAASHQAVAKLKTAGILPRRVQVRSCKYLNNVIEQGSPRSGNLGRSPGRLEICKAYWPDTNIHLIAFAPEPVAERPSSNRDRQPPDLP